MPFYISAAILSSQLTVTIADRVPNLDFMPGCQQAVTVTTGSLKKLHQRRAKCAQSARQVMGTLCVTRSDEMHRGNELGRHPKLC